MTYESNQEELDALLQPYVTEINAMIDSIRLEGTSVDYVSAEDIYFPMVESFVKQTQIASLAETLPQVNPYLAVELGFLTLREAIREGFLPLNKSHVLSGTISIKELPREILKELNFSAAEYERLEN